MIGVTEQVKKNFDCTIILFIFDLIQVHNMSYIHWLPPTGVIQTYHIPITHT